MTSEQGPAVLVTVLNTLMVTLVPQHASEALGGSKLQLLPHSTVLLLAQVSTGGVVSPTVKHWLQMLLFAQPSLARPGRGMTREQGLAVLVTVLSTLIVTLVPQHPS